ncbi:carboxypeptidase M32 [Erysipelothrix rhusiopathiae]|uniref:carboxypeptidase M32 n=1 Tax=Erysipelothrix rhusiopathiae TaxID=1648 RepID=UPI000F43796D|nr:carboxypeptidase M32 [Erysipelothrix rhusiopathiae]AYV34429.1 carboxypeptidase M32 [Erysipelothrix rhusiopathiae]MDE8081655.1 carboxypeptidase M32 [Erysipelothrix rhusiopathiae]MDE8332461.1 carboxypeptidase M32 [Erysipelothrix rhusiopathiae]
MTYEELLDKLNSLNLAITTMSFDALTIAPRNGAAFRNKALSILSGEYFALLTDPKTYQILEESQNNENPIIAESAKTQLRQLNKIKNIPSEEYIAFDKLKYDSQQSWEDAREKGDYDIFKKDLDALILGQKSAINHRNSTLSIYESCLDDYEEGLRESHVEGFFSTIEQKLVPFIDKVIEAQGPKPAFLNAPVTEHEQDLISDLIKEHMGYDASFGYMGHAAHPFSSTFSINDSRITTHYYENDFTSNIFSIIHEIGHSMYNHQVNIDFEGYPIADSMSMSLHESQSRLMENMIGRSKSFWTPLYPKLQAIIPHVLKDVDLNAFIKGINYVEKGYIRVEADELTYPLHIMVRYNTEKEIFNNNHSAEGLDHFFADQMTQLLGITPENPSDGILQDVHWSDASFGYFPTYALGTAYAAQFMKKMEEDINVNEALLNGQMDIVFKWLRENIHQFGGMYNTQTMIEKVTNESFNPNYYIDYLIEKYSTLLGI